MCHIVFCFVDTFLSNRSNGANNIYQLALCPVVLTNYVLPHVCYLNSVDLLLSPVPGPPAINIPGRRPTRRSLIAMPEISGYSQLYILDRRGWGLIHLFKMKDMYLYWLSPELQKEQIWLGTVQWGGGGH